MEPGREPRVSEHVSAWNEAVWLVAEALGEARFVDRYALRRRLDALRDLHEAVTILDRAAEAQSPPVSVVRMRGAVRALRRDACGVLIGMADGQDVNRSADGQGASGRGAAGRRIDSIDATLGRPRVALEVEAGGTVGRDA